MTEINFLITEKGVNQMSWGEYEFFERAQEGEVKLYRLRPVLARFMLDEKDHNFMEHDKAMKILSKVPTGKVKETISKFMDTLKASTIPKGSGTPSELPLEAPTVGSESPVG